MINEVRKRLRHHKARYEEKMRELAKIIRDNNWTDESKDSFRSYWFVRDQLSVKNGHILYEETRYVQDIDARSEILENAQGVHKDKSRSAARLRESFW